MVNLSPDKSNLFQAKRVTFCNFIFMIVKKHKCRIYSFDISWYPISPYIITSESYITLMRISQLIANQRSAGLFNRKRAILFCFSHSLNSTISASLFFAVN